MFPFLHSLSSTLANPFHRWDFQALARNGMIPQPFSAISKSSRQQHPDQKRPEELTLALQTTASAVNRTLHNENLHREPFRFSYHHLDLTGHARNSELLLFRPSAPQTLTSSHHHRFYDLTNTPDPDGFATKSPICNHTIANRRDSECLGGGVKNRQNGRRRETRFRCHLAQAACFWFYVWLLLSVRLFALVERLFLCITLRLLMRARLNALLACAMKGDTNIASEGAGNAKTAFVDLILVLPCSCARANTLSRSA